MPFDTLIKAGTVIDGSGNAPVTADIGIKDGIVSEIGRINSRATRTIDADGALVTPGLVDIHTHYDGQATWQAAWHRPATMASQQSSPETAA